MYSAIFKACGICAVIIVMPTKRELPKCFFNIENAVQQANPA
jgi:hypothetical protein